MPVLCFFLDVGSVLNGRCSHTASELLAGKLDGKYCQDSLVEVCAPFCNAAAH
jgi:hypothetical protein